MRGHNICFKRVIWKSIPKLSFFPFLSGVLYPSVFLYFFQGIMLVYDITNEKSFDNIRNWLRNIEEVIIHPNDVEDWDRHFCYSFFRS